MFIRLLLAYIRFKIDARSLTETTHNALRSKWEKIKLENFKFYLEIIMLENFSIVSSFTEC